MRFDPLSFVIGKHGDSGPVRDVVSYLIGMAAGMAGWIWQTLTNVATASFTAVSTTLRDLAIDVTPVQSGSGDPSPTNVRPISGWTGANIANSIADVLSYATIENGGYDAATGTKVQPAGQKRTADFLPATAAIITDGTGGCRVFCYNANKIYLGSFLLIDSPRGKIELIPGTAFITIGGNAAWTTDNGNKIYVASGDNLEATISWQSEAGTVYGGTLTDNGNDTWTLKVTSRSVNLGSLNWGKTDIFYANVPLMKSSFTLKGLCSIFRVLNASQSMVDGAIQLSTNTLVYVNSYGDYASMTAEQFKAAVTGETLVYELANPVSYTLTAESVRALVGQNNIFADTGNINTITFRTH